MKTWQLTIKKPGKLTILKPDILVEADRLLVGKTGALVFVRRDGKEEGWGPNHDDPFYQLDGCTVTRVQAPGTYASCVLLEPNNHDR